MNTSYIIITIIVIIALIIIFYLLFDKIKLHGGITEEEKKVIDKWPYNGYPNMYISNFLNDPDAPAGWKIHLTPTTANALIVVNIVKEYMNRLKNKHIMWKVHSNIKLICEAEHSNEYVHKGFQTGKVFTLYPSDDGEAVRITTELASEFKKAGLNNESFLRLPCDFYLSPGIWTRMGYYRDTGFKTIYERGIDDGVFEDYIVYLDSKHPGYIPKNIDDYEYPFERMYVEDVLNNEDLHYNPSILKHEITERKCSKINNWLKVNNYYMYGYE
jgi:hypothetical protein